MQSNCTQLAPLITREKERECVWVCEVTKINLPVLLWYTVEFHWWCWAD